MFFPRLYQFERGHAAAAGRAQVTMDGNQALAYGLIAGGVRYGAGYPITPWSSIMEILRTELPKYGGLFVQAEDELGAVSMALGFSYAGNLAVTGSAGPGISLEDGSDRLGVDGGDSADCRERPARRAEHRPADERRAKRSCIRRFLAGTATVRASCSRPRQWRIVSTSRSRRRGIARKYSTPVFILSDSSLATRIEAFDEPDSRK